MSVRIIRHKDYETFSDEEMHIKQLKELNLPIIFIALYQDKVPLAYHTNGTYSFYSAWSNDYFNRPMDSQHREIYKEMFRLVPPRNARNLEDK